MAGEILTRLIAGLLTLFVLSRIAGDNPAFRIAQYLFVGVSLGYGFVVLYHQVLLPTFAQIAVGASGGNWQGVLLLAFPFLLGLLFLPRISGLQAGSWLANYPLAIIFGVGTGISLVGVLVGTLIPQILATIPAPGSDALQIVGTLMLAVGVIATLSYFYFTVPPDTLSGFLVDVAGLLGRVLMLIAFGFFFAGALITYLTALSERFDFLIRLLQW
ncbi:MAG: hypothetical protein HC828_11320 [Blastochloris sp.]|nr:hypothetical protein [Blastochloris sp.]